MYSNSLQGLAFLDIPQSLKPDTLAVCYLLARCAKNTLLFTKDNTIHFAVSSGTIKTELSLLG